MDSADIEQIREAVRAELLQARVTEIILTRDEAVAYTKSTGLAAFYRWAKRWSCRSTTNGRYSTSQLAAALAREARGGRYGVRGRKKATTGTQEAIAA